jgi:hypothetical protein
MESKLKGYYINSNSEKFYFDSNKNNGILLHNCDIVFIQLPFITPRNWISLRMAKSVVLLANTYLSIRNNPLTEITIPSSWEWCCVSRNRLEKIEFESPKEIKILDISDNPLTELEYLPNLLKLTCSPRFKGLRYLGKSIISFIN